MVNNEDSDDEHGAKDNRSKSEVLKDCKIKFVNCAEAQKLAKLIVKESTVVLVLMRMTLCDSDKLCAGKVWIHAHSAHESLGKSFGVSIGEYPDLAKMSAWAVLPGTYCQTPLCHLVKRPRSRGLLD